MTQPDLDILQRVFLFEDLSREELSEVFQAMRIITYSRGAEICHEGDSNEFLYVIKSGYLRVSVSDGEGEIRFLSTLASGDCFGELSILTGEPVSANVTAIVDSEIYMMNRNDFTRLVSGHPMVSMKLSYILSKRLKESIGVSGTEQKETDVSAIIGPAESLNVNLRYACDLARCISKGFGRKVLLLICAEDFGQFNGIRPANENSEKKDGEVFRIEEQGDGLSVGVLKRSETELVREETGRLMADFLPRYDHIVLASPMNRAVLQSGLFSHVRKSIMLISALDRDARQHLSQVPAEMEMAVTLFADDENTAFSQRGLVRDIFQGPIFVYITGGGGNRWTAGVLRAARYLNDLNLGVVFGGGGARGFAHVGVMKVLERHGIEPDIYCGSSMGAVVAALCAMGLSANEIEETMRHHWTRKGAIYDFHFPSQALLRGRKLKKMAQSGYGDTSFDELVYRLCVVCADLVSGKEVVMEEGLVKTAVFASSAIPGILPPVKAGKSLLVDGGILNKVPVSVLKEKGIQNVIAVNVSPQRDMSLLSGQPNILQIIGRSTNMMNFRLSFLDLRPGDVLIRPGIDNFDFFAFKQFSEIVEKGEEAAEEAMGEIRMKLNMPGVAYKKD